MDKNNINLIIKTDASIGRSIISAWDEKEIKDDSPVSALAIAHTHKLDKLIVADNSFLNFINLYKGCNKLGIQLIFGIEFYVVENATDLSEESLLTESKVQVYMKNSAGYKDLIKLYSKAHSDKNRFYYNGRLEWSDLKELNEENLQVVVGHYDSFLHKNLLTHKARCIPNFGKIKPIFAVERLKNLPFDDLIINSIEDYTSKNGYDTINCHNIYYYKEKDIDSYCTYRAIMNRSTFSKPQISHFSSCRFSFETYLNHIKSLKL